MEAPKPITPSSSKKKEFPVSIGNINYILSFLYSGEQIKLMMQNQTDPNSGKFESIFSFDQLNKVSKWFKIFDSLEEVYEDMIKLMEKKQIQINMEQNCMNLVFNINMEKIKEFNISLEPKELTKDEIINNLVKKNNELQIEVNNLKKIVGSLEERFNSLEKKLLKNKENTATNKINTNNELFSSNIIDQEDKTTLNNWINLNNDKKINLLYKASRDGDNYQDFYRLCENKGPTITVVHTTKGYKFGGFTKLS